MTYTAELTGAAKMRNLPFEPPPESDHRFQKLVETLPDGILVHSENKIVFVNRSCVGLLAAEESGQLLGKDISDIVDSYYLPEIRNRIRKCYSTGAASPPMESVLIACDGSLVEIEAVAIPISWNGSAAIEVVLRDIRQRNRTERDLKRTEQSLQESE